MRRRHAHTRPLLRAGAVHDVGALVLAGFIALGGAGFLAACGGQDKPPAETAASGDEAATPQTRPPTDTFPAGPRPRVVLEVAGPTEASGEIEIELFPGVAPETVAHFMKLAREGFYDGTTFHRVIPGFMIQGGDPLSKNRDPRDDGQGDPGYAIPDEFNAVSHTRGVLSMANRGEPGTAGSQFFLVLEDQPALDGGYTAFGRVVRGMDLAHRIAVTPRDEYGRHGARDRPLQDVTVKRVRIEDAGAAAASAQAETGMESHGEGAAPMAPPSETPAPVAGGGAPR